MRGNIFFFALILMVLTFSCKHKIDDSKSKNDVIISGKIENATGKSVTIELLSPGKTEVLTTASLDRDGNFSIVLKDIPDSFHRLRIDDENVIYLKLYKGEKISIKATYPGIARNYQIDGSHECKLLKEMNLRLLESSDKLTELKDRINYARTLPNYNFDSLFNVTNEEARNLYVSDKEYLTNFIKTNNKSAVIYMALYQYISTSPILMIENEPEIFDYTLAELKKNHPDLVQTLLLESAITQNKLKSHQINRDYIDLKPGTEAPDFVLFDVNSVKTTLYSFRGQKVIIAFWASWSKQSVQNLTDITELKDKKGLKIILVSLDTDKENWKTSITNNKIDYLTNLCDFKTWESPVVKMYGIKNIPYYILLDSEGKIISVSQNIDNFKSYL
jgi:peroxiredoxin